MLPVLVVKERVQAWKREVGGFVSGDKGREAGTAQGCVPDAHGLDHRCPCGQGCWQSSDLSRRLTVSNTLTVEFLPLAGEEFED